MNEVGVRRSSVPGRLGPGGDLIASRGVPGLVTFTSQMAGPG